MKDIAVKYSLLLMVIVLTMLACSGESSPIKVKTGAQILIERHLKELEGKRVGLVMNPTARINGVHMLDTLLSSGVNITAMFAPEHGFRGDFGDGEVIEDGIDQGTGLPVFSLYGSSKKPNQEMLDLVDILLFDMQDVGARFYTYNSTMKNVIEAASEYGKEIWILDRPNPAGGNYVAGWVLEDEFESFVGSYPVPIAHGLTLGELALMAVGEEWFNTQVEPKLRVIEMEGWDRNMKWADTGLLWFPPSPNLPTSEHAFVYLGTCFIEGTNLSEGRGTDNPFLNIGAKDFSYSDSLFNALSDKYHIGIKPVDFKPVSIPGKSVNPKFQDQIIQGIQLDPTNKFSDPVAFGVEVLHVMMKQTPGSQYRSYIYNLAGSDKITQNSNSNNWGEAFVKFQTRRKKYLLY